MTATRVKRFIVEYEDGRQDELLALDHRPPMYNVVADGAGSRATGAHTNVAVAVLLFWTAITGRWTKYTPAEFAQAGKKDFWPALRTIGVDAAEALADGSGG